MTNPTVDLHKKSTDSLKAAEKLIVHRLLNPSLHCSYYSCLQLSKFFLLEIAKVEASELEPTRDENGIPRNRHDMIIRKLIWWLKENKKDIIEYNQITKLKQKRGEADYSNRDFTLEESQRCYDKAAKVTSFLKGIIVEKRKVD